MKLLVFSAILISIYAETWMPVKRGQGNTVDFNPESQVFEFRIAPKGNSQPRDLDFNLVVRFLDSKSNLLALSSMLFQQKGETVLKDFLRLGTRDGKRMVYCYDRRILNEKLPSFLQQDVMDPSVFLINTSKTPNFANNKVCKLWHDVVASGKIAYAQFAFWDNGRNALRQLDMEFRMLTTETATTTQQPITLAATTEGGQLDNLELASEMPPASEGDVCSVYPGGVVDNVHKESEHYDMNCYHVLAASFGTNPWFIYGAYDDFDYKKSCRALSVYVGGRGFEISRGWMINMDGHKELYQEGDVHELPDVGCTAQLKNLYLSVDCRPGGYPFVLHYDGYMLAHIEVFSKSPDNFGLCFENSRGKRVNWQLHKQDRPDRDCTIQPDITDCAAQAPQCAEFENACDASLARACNELYCEGKEPTPEQICSLSQARRKKCQLTGGQVNAEPTGCPDDMCLRKFFILGVGCPQDPFFTGCPIENYLA